MEQNFGLNYLMLFWALSWFHSDFVIIVEHTVFNCSVYFYSLAPCSCLVLISRLTLESLLATRKRSAIIAVYSGVTRQSSFGIRKYSSALAVAHVGTLALFSPHSNSPLLFLSVVVPP